jgi:hypothetical protein
MTSRSNKISESVLDTLSSIHGVIKLTSDMLLSFGKSYKTIAPIVKPMLNNKSDIGIKSYVLQVSSEVPKKIDKTYVPLIKSKLNFIDTVSANILSTVLNIITNTGVSNSKKVVISILDKDSINVICSYNDFNLIRSKLKSHGINSEFYINRDFNND